MHNGSRPHADATTFPIAIIGAGFAGIGMAIRLKQAGILSFTIFERAGEIGGTYRHLDVRSNDEWQALVAEILERDGSISGGEGCLSVPGITEEVERAERIRVGSLDRDGKPFELEAEGLLSVCIQHEMDHLEGKLFVDYLSELKRQRIKKKLSKARKLDPDLSRQSSRVPLI